MSRPSFRAAVNATCKRCIYDPGASGNWRKQVSSCSAADCPLHPLRPISSARMRERGSAGEGRRKAAALRLDGLECGLRGPALGTSKGGAA